MPTIPGVAGGGFGAVVPLLLAPVNTFAAKRQARYEQLSLMSQLTAESERRLSALKAEDTALQNDFQALANLDVLGPGKARIQQNVAAPLKAAIADRIKNEYGNNYELFQMSEGDSHRARIREAIGSDPTVQRELTNKLNYGQAMKASMDGKVLRPGTLQSMALYDAGAGDTIQFDGAIEPLKDLQDHFGKTFHPSGQFNLGSIDPKTGIQTAPPVSRQEVIDYAKSTGMNDADAKYYVNDYMKYKDGQFSYKIDQQDINWLFNRQVTQKRLQNDDRNFNRQLSNDRFNRQDRLADNARQDAQFAYRKQQDREEKTQAAKDTAAYAGYQGREILFGPGGEGVGNKSNIRVQPILEPNLQNAVVAYAGLQPFNPGQGIPTKYKLPYNSATPIYVEAPGKGGGRSELRKVQKLAPGALDSDGNLVFDTVISNQVTKFPDRNSKSGYSGLIEVQQNATTDQPKRRFFIKLDDSDAGIQQFMSSPDVNKARLPKPSQQGREFGLTPEAAPIIDYTDASSVWPSN